MKIVACSLLITVLAFLAIKTFFIGYYRIPQNGMYPTLPAGSVLFTIRRPYPDISAVKRGDIIVFVREQRRATVQLHLARYWFARRKCGPNLWRVAHH